MEHQAWITFVIFVLTYAGMAIGRVPGLALDRANIALIGAILMLVTGALTLDQAVSTESIDYKTILLLFGMMLVVGFLRLSGFFQRLTTAALKRIRGPRVLLAIIITLAGLLSAFLINDVVCVAMTPLVVHLTRRLRLDPVPFVIALATAANVGSAGTITGNPQNIYIGSHSGISYLHFALHLLPVAMLGLLVNYGLIWWLYRQRLTGRGPNNVSDKANGDYTAHSAEPITESLPLEAASTWLRWKTLLVTLATVALFFTGLPLELIALGAAAVLLLGRVPPARAFAEVDWGLLVMFIGLFMVVHAFQLHIVSRWGIAQRHVLFNHPITLLSGVTVALSNIVSNVPAVLLLEPVVQAIPAIPARQTGWLTLAMASTFAGNLTVLGSVANLIVVESAARERVVVSFWDYCKVGIPLTCLTVALGIIWLKYVPY